MVYCKFQGRCTLLGTPKQTANFIVWSRLRASGKCSSKIVSGKLSLFLAIHLPMFQQTTADRFSFLRFGIKSVDLRFGRVVATVKASAIAVMRSNSF